MPDRCGRPAAERALESALRAPPSVALQQLRDKALSIVQANHGRTANVLGWVAVDDDLLWGELGRRFPALIDQVDAGEWAARLAR